MQYKIGTATFTNGSATVTGSGTAWLANVSAGDYIVRVGDAVSYEVASVASDTSLTLTANYGGVTGSGLSYVAHKDFHPNGAPKWANGDVEFAAIQNRWNAQLLAGPFGTAALLDTGTAAGELPLNSDLGTAAFLDTGTAAGELPTNGDLPTFGTAATADVTTSATDATPGRVTKVGDFGIGALSAATIADANLALATGVYSISGGAVLNIPSGVVNAVLWVGHWASAVAKAQLLIDVSNDRMYQRANNGATWQPWREIFHTGNAATYNGAQQGATPNGSIIESYVSGFWEVIKLADGTMLMWYKNSAYVGFAINNAYGSLFQGTVSFLFPEPFIESPKGAGDVTYSSGASWGNLVSSTTTAATVRGWDIVTRDSTQNSRVGIFVIGRWK